MSKWKEYLLPELLFFQEGPGVRNHQYTTSGIKLLNVANLTEDFIDLSKSDRYISEEEAFGRYKHFLVNRGDFIIASSGITIDTFDGKMGFVEEKHLPLCMNTSTIRFKPLDKNKIEIKFFKYFLKSLNFKDQLRKHITGAVILNFGPSHLKKTYIPLPPIQMQKEIAKILDKASELVALRKKQLDELDNLAESVFHDMFGDPVKNEKGWRVKNIMTVCEKIADGPFGSNLKTSDYKKYGVRVIRLENIGILKFNDDLKSFISEEKYEKLNRYTVKKEDIIFSSFVIDKIRVSLLPNTLDKAINKADCFLVRPDNSKINKYYLVYYLASDSMHNQIYDKIHGQTRPRVNTTQLKQTQIPLPPLALQNKFATIVEKIEEQKSEVKKALLESEDLFQKLMQDLLNPD